MLAGQEDELRQGRYRGDAFGKLPVTSPPAIDLRLQVRHVARRSKAELGEGVGREIAACWR